MSEKEYDVLVIGSGAAGSSAATNLPKQGLRVAMVESDRLGGTCLNYGCDPTKSFLHIAGLLHQTHQFARYGLQVSDVTFDWNGVLAYVQKVVNQMRGGTPAEARQNLEKQGVEVLQGQARFVSPHQVEVDGHTLKATNIVIATGTEASALPIEGLKEVGYITNVEAVSLAQLPRRLAIIGGGAIGIEFAQLFRRYGVEITILEHSRHILDTEDQELAQLLVKQLAEEGIRMETGVQLKRVEKVAEGKKLIYQCPDKDQEDLVVDEILVSVGRKLALEPLNLKAAGVQASQEDGIKVDKFLRTNVPHIWAAGDVLGGLKFTHLATAQGTLVAHNILAQSPQPFEPKVIPWVTYTDPSLAHAGQTEEQLKKDGLEYQALRLPLQQVERAIIDDVTTGMVKLLVGKDQKILGGHILAANAGNLLAPIVLAMSADLSVRQLANVMLPYPTLAEAVKQAAQQVKS